MSNTLKITKEPYQAHQAYQESDQPPYQHAVMADVEGIELFEATRLVNNSPIPYQEPTNTLPAGLSIKDAARVLGISSNTVRARIKSGEISACKVKGPTGEQWRVFIGNPSGDYQQLTNTLPIASQNNINIEISRLLDMIEKQSVKLEAASGQIGYLKSQLEERERELETSQEQIKLLTDSQHKKGWWARLKGLLGSDNSIKLPQNYPN